MKKHLYICTLILSLLFISCRDVGVIDDSDMTLKQATLTGYDVRDCICCGGLMISFKANAQSYSDTFYLIKKFPENTGISSTSKFPMAVLVDYSFDSLNCIGNKFINISRIKIK